MSAIAILLFSFVSFAYAEGPCADGMIKEDVTDDTGRPMGFDCHPPGWVCHNYFHRLPDGRIEGGGGCGPGPQPEGEEWHGLVPGTDTEPPDMEGFTRPKPAESPKALPPPERKPATDAPAPPAKGEKQDESEPSKSTGNEEDGLKNDRPSTMEFPGSARR